MNASDVNTCMNILNHYADEARAFASHIFATCPVTQNGSWGDVSWWKQVVSKYLQTGALACGGAALAACAEFKARDTDIDPSSFLRLWIVQSDSPYKKSALTWLGIIPVKASTVHTLNQSADEVFDAIDTELFGVDDCLYMLDYGVKGQLANRVCDFIAEKAPELMPLAQYMIENPGFPEGKLAERWRT